MRYEFRLSTIPDIELIHTTLMYNGHSMAQLNSRILMELRDYLNEYCKPRLYKLDPHGYVEYEEWKGQERFLEDHPLPDGVRWERKKRGYDGQIRLHRSDADPVMDVYGLDYGIVTIENIPIKIAIDPILQSPEYIGQFLFVHSVTSP